MNKRSIAWILLLTSIFIFSFRQDEKNPYFRQYYSKNCHCVVRENLDKGRLMMYEELDSATLETNGIHIDFNKNGDTINVSHYTSGKEDGLIYTNYPNGKLGAIGQFKNGLRVGIWKEFTEDGKIIKETIYDNTNDTDNNYLVKYYGANDILIYSEQFAGYQVTDTKVFNQKLYDKALKLKDDTPGKRVFIANCAACHNPYRDVVGPKLAGVTGKRTDKWLRSFIANSEQMIADGDEKAIELYDKYSKTRMPSYSLSQQEMDQLMDYISSLK